MAWVEVNLSAIRQNALAVKSHIDCRRLIAVVKADAYGHGLLPVAQTLTNIADLLAVATVSEAAELRKNQIHSPILTLYSNQLTEVEKIVEYIEPKPLNISPSYTVEYVKVEIVYREPRYERYEPYIPPATIQPTILPSRLLVKINHITFN